MNQKQIFSALAVVLVGAVIIGSQWKSAGPSPEPDPGPPATAVAQAAANDGASFLNGLADVCEEGARKIRSKDFQTTKEAALWQKSQNDDLRFKAFTPWHAAIDEAKKVDEKSDSLEKLADAWDQSAIGFRAATAKGK